MASGFVYSACSNGLISTSEPELGGGLLKMLCNWIVDLFESFSLDSLLSGSFANGLKVGAGGGRSNRITEGDAGVSITGSGAGGSDDASFANGLKVGAGGGGATGSTEGAVGVSITGSGAGGSGDGSFANGLKGQEQVEVVGGGATGSTEGSRRRFNHRFRQAVRVTGRLQMD